MAQEDREKRLARAAEEILEQRAASLALETADEEVTDRLALLLFRIADEWYAVSVADVREIFQEYHLTPIPCVPDFVQGVTNVRGEILSVTDPARLMRLGSIVGEEGVQPPAVVLVSGEIATALIVDEIGDIAEVPNNSVEPPVSIIDRAQADFIAGSVYVDGAMIGLLNVGRVLEPVGQARTER